MQRIHIKILFICLFYVDGDVSVSISIIYNVDHTCFFSCSTILCKLDSTYLNNHQDTLWLWFTTSQHIFWQSPVKLVTVNHILKVQNYTITSTPFDSYSQMYSGAFENQQYTSVIWYDMLYVWYYSIIIWLLLLLLWLSDMI